MNNKRLDKHMYCKFSGITLNKAILESKAWKELTQSQIQVFIYIWSCLQWRKNENKSLKRTVRRWYPPNNGNIEISTIKMRKKLCISKATCTNAIHKLITVGLISLTRVGANKICHMYKILYYVVPTIEERWRKYPEKNWNGECPKSPNNLVGVKTRFKSHPKKVNRKSDN